MTLLTRITQTIGGPNPQPAGRQRGYDPDQSNEERIVEQQNLNQQNQDSLPAHPHADEPQETEAEHRTEQVIGKEIRPAQRRPIPAMVRPSRPFPAKMMSCTVPDVTGARRMMSKPAPRGSMTGDFMSFSIPKATAPKGSRLDPFKGLDSIERKKKKRLPVGMELFGKKGTVKRGMW